MLVEWSTDEVPPAERFSHWREACCEHVYALTPESESPGAFWGRLARLQSGLLDVADIRCAGHRVLRREEDIRRQGSGTYYVYLQRSGRAWFEQGGRQVLAAQGDVVVADPEVAFATGSDGDFDFRLWRIPRGRLDPLLALRDGVLPMVKLSAGDGGAVLVRRWLDALVEQQAVLDAAGLRSAFGALCDVVAGTVAAPRLVVEAGSGAAHARRQARLDRAMQEIRQRAFDLELGTDALAAALGLSTRSLHLLFEGSGQTLHGYLQQVRLGRAMQLLRSAAGMRMSTVEIGFACGFREPSTFYRQFRARYGFTPGEARAQGAVEDGEARP